MNPFLAILRKDLRRFWPLLALVWAACALNLSQLLFSFPSLLSPAGRPKPYEISFIAPLQWALLGIVILVVVQADRILDHRASWQTRPVKASTLVGAKLAVLGIGLLLPCALLDAFAVAHLKASFSTVLATFGLSAFYLFSGILSLSVISFISQKPLHALLWFLGWVVLTHQLIFWFTKLAGPPSSETWNTFRFHNEIPALWRNLSSPLPSFALRLWLVLAAGIAVTALVVFLRTRSAPLTLALAALLHAGALYVAVKPDPFFDRISSLPADTQAQIPGAGVVKAPWSEKVATRIQASDRTHLSIALPIQNLPATAAVWRTSDLDLTDLLGNTHPLVAVGASDPAESIFALLDLPTGRAPGIIPTQGLALPRQETDSPWVDGPHRVKSRLLVNSVSYRNVAQLSLFDDKALFHDGVRWRVRDAGIAENPRTSSISTRIIVEAVGLTTALDRVRQASFALYHESRREILLPTTPISQPRMDLGGLITRQFYHVFILPNYKHPSQRHIPEHTPKTVDVTWLNEARLVVFIPSLGPTLTVAMDDEAIEVISPGNFPLQRRPPGVFTPPP